MEKIIDGRKPLTNDEKALKLAQGYINRDFDTVIVGVKTHSIFTEDSESLQAWAVKNKEVLIVVKKDGKVLIGEDSVVEQTVEEKPKKKNK